MPVRAFVVAFFLAAAASTAFAQSADLFITKTGPATANVGDNITFTVTIGNAGPDDAASATMTDTLPSGATFVSETQTTGPTFACSTPAVGSAGGTVNCTIATFTNGSSATFNIVVNVSAGSAGTNLVNAAVISSGTPDNNSENNTSSAGTSIAGGNLADVSVTKTAPSFAAPGSTVSFQITVRDLGPNDASSVVLNDALGAGFTFVSFAQTSGPTFTCPGSTTPCNIGTLPNGSSATFTLQATISSTPGTYSNSASITSANDPNPENDSTIAFVTASTADVGVTKSAPATATAGSTFNYTITLSNGGPGFANNATFTDVLPSGIQFVSVAQTSGPSSGACSGGSTVTCAVSEMLNGESDSFNVTVKPSASVANGTIVTNTATASSSTTDTNPNNNSSSAMTTISAQADVSVTKTGSATVTAGNAVSYTITVANAGPSDAATVSWTDVLPANTTFVSLTQTSGPAFTCTTGATVNCSIPTFTTGASATFALTANVSAAATGSISNTATITSTTLDPNPANNTTTATSTVSTQADLSIVKSAPANAAAGGTLSYTITVADAGPSSASTVSWSDTLPANTTFASLTQTSGPSFTCTTGATVNCSIALLPAGSTAVFTLTANVSLAAIAGSTISNTATITSSTADPNPANNASTATTTVTTQADLSITKSGPSSANAGTTLAYAITATNAGPSNASPVSWTDVLPASTTFVSLTQTAGPSFTCSTPAAGGTGTITCTVPSLAPAASSTFSLVITASSTLATGAVISNTATITSSTPDPNNTNNSASATTFIGIGAADVSITKTAPSTPIYATQPFSYTITVANAGPSTAQNVVMTDALPAGVTFGSVTSTQGTCSGTSTVTCQLRTLVNGATATIVLTVTPTVSTSITNTATVAAAGPDLAPANNAATATVTPQPAANIPAISGLGLLLLGFALSAAALLALRH